MTILNIVPLLPGQDQRRDICIIARLLKETIRRTRKALIDGNYKCFDANPGDGGCQNRALFFATRNVRPEIDAIYQRVSSINAAIQKFERDGAGDLLNEQFSFPTSKDCQFCLLSYILTVTKVKAQVLESGIVMTKTDIGNLGSLTKNFDRLCLDRRQLVSHMQARLAEMSNVFMQEEGARFDDPVLTEKLQRIEMGIWVGFPPRPFGFLFYQIDTLLRRIEEEEIIICFRNVRPKFTILMQNASMIEDCDPQKLVVVFEGATARPEEEMRQLINDIGFTQIVRYSAAIERQFGPQSPLASDDEGVLAVRALHLDLGDFVLDHIYTQTRRLL